MAFELSVYQNHLGGWLKPMAGAQEFASLKNLLMRLLLLVQDHTLRTTNVG